MPPPEYDEVQASLGPGLSADPETLKKILKLQQEFNANPKSVEVMKDFMSKTVEQLAADDPYVPGLETIRIRGMDVVLPKSGSNRSDTILFAALTALRHPEIDSIFRQLKLRAQAVEDGKIVLKRLVPDTVEAEAKPIQGISEPHRNILVGHTAFDPKKDRIVAVLPPDKGGPMWIGLYDREYPTAEVEKDGTFRRAIRPLFGDVVQQIREEELIPIRTESQLCEIFNSIASQK
jgi:hypothetical protein